jgi:serine/threonine protein kinase
MSVFQQKATSPAESPKLTLRLEDYELGTCIGQGSSACVYIAKYLPTGTQVAIKILDLDMFERNQIDELRVFFYFVDMIERDSDNDSIKTSQFASSTWFICSWIEIVHSHSFIALRFGFGYNEDCS